MSTYVIETLIFILTNRQIVFPIIKIETYKMGIITLILMIVVRLHFETSYITAKIISLIVSSGIIII